jgi:hypothetical protein
MVSQTEQSTAEPEQQPQSEQSLSQPEPEPVQEESQSQPEPVDLQQEHSQQEHLPSTDDPVEVDTQPTIAEIESTLQEINEPEASEPTADVAVAESTEAPAVSNYENIDAIFDDLGNMDAAVRAKVEPILELVANQKEIYQKASADFDSAMARMDAFMEDIRDYGIESEPVMDRFKDQETSIIKLNNACVETTWYAFKQMHPDYDDISIEAKKTFGNVVNTMLQSFTGANPLEKLQEAYKYTQYKYGLKSHTEAKSAPVEEPKPVVNKQETVNNDSRAQSLVNDSSTLHSEPVVSVDDMSWDEIMNRHLHLLES